MDLFYKFKNIIINDTESYSKIFNCILKDDPEKELCIYQYLKPKKVKGKNRILIRPKEEGRYVLLDDFKGISKAYSFGIEHNVEFNLILLYLKKI